MIDPPTLSPDCTDRTPQAPEEESPLPDSSMEENRLVPLAPQETIRAFCRKQSILFLSTIATISVLAFISFRRGDYDLCFGQLLRTRHQHQLQQWQVQYPLHHQL